VKIRHFLKNAELRRGPARTRTQLVTSVCAALCLIGAVLTENFWHSRISGLFGIVFGIGFVAFLLVSQIEFRSS
jgi:hypothetical protein